jgi:ABC-type oligopeptide transport system substrate-binding subunit
VTRNVTGLEDPQVAVYLEKITGELNADKQYQLLSKLDTLLTQDLPTLPLFQAPVSLVQQADIVNVSESAGSAGPLWDAEDWVVELASANS